MQQSQNVACCFTTEVFIRSFFLQNSVRETQCRATRLTVHVPCRREAGSAFSTSKQQFTWRLRQNIWLRNTKLCISLRVTTAVGLHMVVVSCVLHRLVNSVRGRRWRSWLRHCATAEGPWFDSRPHYGPRVDSTSNRNEYQEYFMEGKGGRYVELTTLPPSRTNCLGIWEPQPPGTLTACPGL